MTALLTHPPALVWLAGTCIAVVVAVAAVIGLRHAWLARNDRVGRADRIRDLASGLTSNLLLFFFWAVTAGLVMTNLVGFGRDQMRLGGIWPYLLYFALDGAAAFCMVLIMRRARRDESATVLRLFVWLIVAGSSWFNAAHSPPNVVAEAAYSALPVIAAVLFEFALAETRRARGRRDRRMSAVRWLHPIERVRVQMAMAADEDLSVDEATHRVRVEQAARRLYALRLTLTDTGLTVRLRRWLHERRAQAALARARFTDPAIAVEVLGHVQVLVRTRDLAALDYSASPDVRQMLAEFLTAHSPAAHPNAPHGTSADGLRRQINGTGAAGGAAQLRLALDGTDPSGAALLEGAAENGVKTPPLDEGDADEQMLATARQISDDARGRGERLTQTALARELRGRGFSIANHRLGELAERIGLRPARTSKDAADV